MCIRDFLQILQPISLRAYKRRRRGTVKPEDKGIRSIFRLSDIHVSLLSRKDTRGQARSRERALSGQDLPLALGASRLWSD